MSRVSAVPSGPFSRPIEVGSIGSEGRVITIEADARERQALAALNGLVGVEECRATLRFRQEGRTGCHVTGTLQARVVQTCVLTLDSFEAGLEVPIDVHFLPEREVEGLAAEAARRGPSSAEPEVTDADLPDPIVAGRIDVGALAAEFLALALDPYPKKAGIEFSGLPSPDGRREPSPFAVLGRLKSPRPD